MTQLTRYEAMRTAIQVARDFDDIKPILDKAEALRLYAQQAHDADLECWVTAIKVRAARRIGELSSELETSKGGSNPEATLPAGGKSKRRALADAGLSTAAAQRYEKVASLNEDAFEQWLGEAAAQHRPVTIRECLSRVLKAERGAKYEVGERPTGESCTVADLSELSARGARFGTIYADPPWLYGNQATRASTDNHYAGMTVDAICALPVASLAADVAHLHLWTTNGFLFDAQRIIEAWGFEYRSCFVWVKPQMGIGNYWRVSHEFMLLGVRGAQTFLDHSLMSWGEFRRAQHSAKPEEIRGMVERASPGPRLELFGRRAVDGWTVWGNQIERNLFYPVAA